MHKLHLVKQIFFFFFKEKISVFQDFAFRSNPKKIQATLLHCLTFKLATFVLLVQLFMSIYRAALHWAPWLNTGTYLANEKDFDCVPQILHAVFHFLTLPSLAPHHTHFNGKLSTQTVIARGQRPNNPVLHPAVHYARHYDVTWLPCLLISCQ